MKALISTTEVFTWQWLSAWEKVSTTETEAESMYWVPVYSQITNCQRVAQVEPDDKTFPVYDTLIWVDCPESCVADEWYFKDGVCSPKPQDVPMPPTPVEVLP
jgi:hypothetical protein